MEREPGSNPEFYLVRGCSSLKWESLQGSREFVESGEVVTTHVILLLQVSLASALYEKTSQLFSSYLPPLYSASLLSAAVDQPPSVTCLLILPHHRYLSYAVPSAERWFLLFLPLVMRLPHQVKSSACRLSYILARLSITSLRWFK